MNDGFRFLLLRRIRTKERPELPTEQKICEDYKNVGFSGVELRGYANDGTQVPSGWVAVYVKA